MIKAASDKKHPEHTANFQADDPAEGGKVANFLFCNFRQEFN